MKRLLFILALMACEKEETVCTIKYIDKHGDPQTVKLVSFRDDERGDCKLCYGFEKDGATQCRCSCRDH